MATWPTSELDEPQVAPFFVECLVVYGHFEPPMTPRANWMNQAVSSKTCVLSLLVTFRVPIHQIHSSNRRTLVSCNEKVE